MASQLQQISLYLRSPKPSVLANGPATWPRSEFFLQREFFIVEWRDFILCTWYFELVVWMLGYDCTSRVWVGKITSAMHCWRVSVAVTRSGVGDSACWGVGVQGDGCFHNTWHTWKIREVSMYATSLFYNTQDVFLWTKRLLRKRSCHVFFVEKGNVWFLMNIKNTLKFKWNKKELCKR